MIKCNIRGMNSTVNVDTKSFSLQYEKSSEKAINFINSLEKEVMKLSSKEKKSLKKKLLAISTSISTLSLTTHAMASTQNLQIQDVFSNDLITFIVGLVGGSVAIGVLLALLTGTWSGIIQMFNMEAQAKKWRKNILDGTGVMLFFPVVIIMIVLLGHLLFGNTPVFVDPWNFITHLFK